MSRSLRIITKAEIKKNVRYIGLMEDQEEERNIRLDLGFFFHTHFQVCSNQIRVFSSI